MIIDDRSPGLWSLAFLVALTLHAGIYHLSRAAFLTEPTPVPITISLQPASLNSAETDVVSNAEIERRDVTEPDRPEPIESEVSPERETTLPPNPKVQPVQSRQRPVPLPRNPSLKPEHPKPVEKQLPERTETEPVVEASDIETTDTLSAEPDASETSIYAPTASEAVRETKAIPSNPEQERLTQSWRDKLSAHLARHKRYPHYARARHMTGTVAIRIAINRQGEVIESSIEQSSGHRILDDATLRMLERASPLPKPPDSVDERQLSMIIPVRFSLR